MTRRIFRPYRAPLTVLLAAFVTGCAHSTPQATAAPQAKAEPAKPAEKPVADQDSQKLRPQKPTPPRILPMPAPDTTGIPSPDVVPAGEGGTLIHWGAAPKGMEH